MAKNKPAATGLTRKQWIGCDTGIKVLCVPVPAVGAADGGGTCFYLFSLQPELPAQILCGSADSRPVGEVTKGSCGRPGHFDNKSRQHAEKMTENRKNAFLFPVYFFSKSIENSTVE